MDWLAWIYVCLLCWLFFWLWRDYRLDSFRQQLFRIRDDLFDLAADGVVPFDSPAYKMLRDAINSNIRFGHRLGFLEMLVFSALTRNDPCRKRSSEQYRREWNAACRAFDRPIIDKIENIRVSLHVSILEQMILTSAVLMCSLMTFVFVATIYSLPKAAAKKTREFLSIPKVARFFDRWDGAALVHARVAARAWF